MALGGSPGALAVRRRSARVARALLGDERVHRLTEAARDLRRRGHDRAWRRLLSPVLTDGVTTDAGGSWGRPDSPGIPLVMCLWNRPERLAPVLEMLSRLDDREPVRLLLWNNQARDAATYLATVRDFVPHGGLASVDLVTSPVNLGGLARFVALRLLHNAGYRGPAVFLDDDQDVSPSFVRDLLGAWRPRTIVAWWAFSQHGSYWSRAEVAPGSHADHAGTGGTVLDADLVADDAFFVRLPRRFAFLEDQWMSFVARERGWDLVKGDTTVTLVSEERNQYHALKELKDVFFAWQESRRGHGVPAVRARPGWRRGHVEGPSA